MSFHAIQTTVYAIIVASLMPFVFTIIAKTLGGFSTEDNQQPRVFLQNLAKNNPRAYRAHCAQENSFEILPVFYISVLLALFLVVPLESVNKIAWAFVLFRVAYGLAYIANFAALRSCLWLLSLACPLLLFYFCIRIA